VTESPLAQFEIHRLILLHLAGYDISFTNGSLLMLISAVLSVALIAGGAAPRALVPGRWQSVSELCYEFVTNMVQENCGTEGMKYMPWVFSIFLFVLFGNFLGVVPYSFTFTSHIIVTGAMAMMVFLVVTFIAFARHGMHFFSFFLPAGVPWWLWWLIVPIEIVSYLSRPFSLAIRLFANMIAGHMMMKIVAGFTIMMGFYLAATSTALGVAVGALPVAVNAVLTLFEFMVAVLQAYVFAVLTSLYLKDAIELH
jgi:F-type H+-transporting ATPase subunit a